MTDMLLNLTSENICYFKNFHHALRENPRIDTVLKTPRCTVLKVKFFGDKKRIAFSLSNGLLIIYNSIDYLVQKVIVSKHAILDSIKLVEDKFLITAGIDPKIRVWNIETEKAITKFQVHQFSTIFLVCHKDCIFSYGFDMKLAKYNFKSKSLDSFLEIQTRMTALKLLKTPTEDSKHKLAAAFITGEIILYDLNLN